jgi:A/G-specific adenine glycosylase
MKGAPGIKKISAGDPKALPNESYFTRKLLEWHHRDNRREMPWKGIRDPYKIWLSEIILQQTRVAQGLSYYLRLLTAYPDIQQLAAAPDAAVMKLWEGLGYYTRCRNMLRTARIVVTNYQGKLPASYEKLLELPGIGPYTAAAIASFAFRLPHAVVDGNVSRVLSRFFGIETPIDTTIGKQLFAQLANRLLDSREPGIYNQAIMDFGATVCMPQQPICGSCPLEKKCAARQNGAVHRLPVKEKAVTKKIRWVAYFVFEYQGKWCIQERTAKDIWQNLFEFYSVETEGAMEWSQPVIAEWLQQQGIRRFHLDHISALYTQLLTHREIRATFIRVKLTGIPQFLKNHRWMAVQKMKTLPFPRIINRWLDDVL